MIFLGQNLIFYKNLKNYIKIFKTKDQIIFINFEHKLISENTRVWKDVIRRILRR